VFWENYPLKESLAYMVAEKLESAKKRGQKSPTF